MSVIRSMMRAVARRLGDERGFTLLMALAILLITSTLTAALFLAVQSEASFSGGDLDGNRAYAAAQSGVQAYLQQLNANAADSSWWQDCQHDSQTLTNVPGTSGEEYSYKPVVTCVQGQAVDTLVDPDTGLLRMEFTGQVEPGGTQPNAAPQYGQQRTIVASFRPTTPLSYLWYTVHETVDPAVDSKNCATEPFYYQGGVSTACEISWATGDTVNGPMYTQDSYLIDGTPHLGSANSDDPIASNAPTTSVCVGQNGRTETCPPGVVRGKAEAGAKPVPFPSDNVNLLTDASNPADGVVLNGTTTLILNGTTATATTCTSTDANSCSTQQIDLTKTPLIYDATAQGSPGCPAYTTPASGVSYPRVLDAKSTLYGGNCGDIYVSGSYTTPVTIDAADDVIVTNDIVDQSHDASGMPTGTSTLGLVATQYVRVMHTCAGSPPRTIDGAILTIDHSFFVDNYGCGGVGRYLTVNGAIAQKYRGIVAEEGVGGYLKNYNYDQRLGLLLPPYMFDLQNASWTVVRQTLCSTSLPSSNTASCSNSP